MNQLTRRPTFGNNTRVEQYYEPGEPFFTKPGEKLNEVIMNPTAYARKINQLDGFNVLGARMKQGNAMKITLLNKEGYQYGTSVKRKIGNGNQDILRNELIVELIPVEFYRHIFPIEKFPSPYLITIHENRQGLSEAIRNKPRLSTDQLVELGNKLIEKLFKPACNLIKWDELQLLDRNDLPNSRLQTFEELVNPDFPFQKETLIEMMKAFMSGEYKFDADTLTRHSLMIDRGNFGGSTTDSTTEEDMPQASL